MQDPEAFTYVPEKLLEQSQKLKEMKAILDDPLRVLDHDGISEELCMFGVHADWSTFELLEEQTEAICLEAVKQKGELLAYVQNQNLQICLEAVKQNPDALRYVKELYRDAVLRQLKQAA